MSDRPTPETNEAKREGLLRGNPVPTQVVHVSFAERLEQQRDELQRAVQNHRGAANIAIEALDRAITQRNEARELARELRDALQRASDLLERAGIEQGTTWEPGQSWIFREDKCRAKNDVEQIRGTLTKAKEVLP